MTNGKPQTKPGRPPCDVSEQVFAHVSRELANRSLAEAARKRLVVFDGRGNIVRKMKGNYLEAIYREAERARAMPWQRPTEGYVLAHPIFMKRPLPIPIGAAMPSERKPGRPKKI